MGEIVSIHIVAFFLLLLLRFDPSDTSAVIFVDYQLHEGSPCLMTDWSEGQCVKAVDCPEKILQIWGEKYSDTNRCGFSNTAEVVCCSKTSLRPAGSACAKYAKMLHIRPGPGRPQRPANGRSRGRRQLTGSNIREVRPLEAQECSRTYNQSIRLPHGLNDGIICARDYHPIDKSDTCQGDSGGPLYFNATGFGSLAGITSFGFLCGGNAPGGYTSVYNYIDWIEEIVWPNKFIHL